MKNQTLHLSLKKLFASLNNSHQGLSYSSAFLRIAESAPSELPLPSWTNTLAANVFHQYFTPLEVANDKRRAEWAVSRKCLLDALNQVRGAENNLKHARVSLSHTRLASIALACLNPPEEIFGIGVDLEVASRRLSPALVARIVQSTPAESAWEPLKLWTIKEACYKALPRQFQTQVTDFEICTLPSEPVGKAKLNSQTEVSLDFTTSFYDGHEVAFAICYSKKSLS